MKGQLRDFNLDEFRLGEQAYGETVNGEVTVLYVAEDDDYLWIKDENGRHTTITIGKAMVELKMAKKLKRGFVNIDKTDRGIFFMEATVFEDEKSAETSGILSHAATYFKTIPISWEE